MARILLAPWNHSRAFAESPPSQKLWPLVSGRSCWHGGWWRRKVVAEGRRRLEESSIGLLEEEGERPTIFSPRTRLRPGASLVSSASLSRFIRRPGTVVQ